MPAKPFDFSNLPEHMRERERLNQEMTRQFQLEARAKGFKIL